MTPGPDAAVGNGLVDKGPVVTGSVDTGPGDTGPVDTGLGADGPAAEGADVLMAAPATGAAEPGAAEVPDGKAWSVTEGATGPGPVRTTLAEVLGAAGTAVPVVSVAVVGPLADAGSP
ncbi:MAG TPA: hypothetical protein VID75_13190 [Acidimicrobiales bacterium]